MSDDKILKAAGKRGKTKNELSARLGLGHSYISRRVNALVREGRLAVTGTVKPVTGRPAPRYGRTDS